jgi:hypothetical protein
MADNDDESGGSSIVGVKVEVLGKALEKLIELIGAGSRALYAPEQVRRMAQAEVDAQIIRTKGARTVKLLEASFEKEDRQAAEAERDVIDGEIVENPPALTPGATTLLLEENEEDPIPLVQRLTRAAQVQAVQSQANVEAVVAEAAQEIRDIPDEEISDKPVDPTFATRILDYAQDASDDRVRTLWAKLLVDEVRHGEGSLRALEVLRTLNADEARKFEVLARCAAIDGVVAVGDGPEVRGLTFADLLTLSEAGLLSENFNLATTFRVGGGPSDGTEKFGVALVYPRHAVRVACTDEYDGRIPALRLTMAGRIIARALNLDTNMEWVRQTCDRIKGGSRALRVSVHEIRERRGEQVIVSPVPLYEAP